MTDDTTKADELASASSQADTVKDVEATVEVHYGDRD